MLQPVPRGGAETGQRGEGTFVFQRESSRPANGSVSDSAELAAATASQITLSSKPDNGSDLEWWRIRPIFEHLHLDEDKTLKEIMTELRLNHAFRATEQMFKKRIRRWGLDKNLKQHEVEHILGIEALRRGQGKETFFTLRGRKVDMRNVSRFQQRKRLKTSVAISNYMSGLSKECRDLRPLTPPVFDPSSWKTSDQPYENTLRAFGALFHGLVDSRYYWMESNEIVMPPSTLRGEVSDVCTNLVASNKDGLNPIVVRKLSLLMESVVHSGDAWIHCRLIYMLWVISSAGHMAVTKALLTHLNGLVAVMANQPCAQYCFVQHYSSLEASHAMKLAGDIISLKADMVGAFRVESPVAFKLRSLEYDVFWRQREQGTGMTLSRALGLLQRCNNTLGLMAVETLTVLRIVLEDFVDMPAETPSLRCLLEYLEDTKKLEFDEQTLGFTFDGQPLGMEAASELACVYCRVGLHHTEACIFQRVLAQHRQTASYLRREYSLLVRISQCSELRHHSCGRAWLQRKQEIEKVWQVEVEAAAPTAELVDNCR